MMATTCRNLIVVLGDQLNTKLAMFDGVDKQKDFIWMAEVTEESTKIPVHKVRSVYFLSAMRHFKEHLESEGYRVHYTKLDDKDNEQCFSKELERALKKLEPEKVILIEPGEWQIKQDLIKLLDHYGQPYEMRKDNGFLCSIEEFADYAKGRKQLRMEFFYREMRKRYQVLMKEDEPEAGQWNFDKSNRGSFDKSGPEKLPVFGRYEPDSVTREVIELIEQTFPDNPGSLGHFDWPVTYAQARKTLDQFIEAGLPDFGTYQDAMWTNEAFLYHSRLSAALNVRLIGPLEVIQAVEEAYKQGKASIEATEGYIRQILGWREYIRGMYWLFMPEWKAWNALEAKEPLPELYWTGDTKMHCLSQCVGQTLEYGYAHHIQRLMVTGLFSLLLGVKPQEIHEWYLAVYLDAVEWVELPNTLGMSQFVDGGKLASKPYVATGNYIKKMSNYCSKCEFDPKESKKEGACPFTTFYWDFLLRHEETLKPNNRMRLQLRNLERLNTGDRAAISRKANEYREALQKGAL